MCIRTRWTRTTSRAAPIATRRSPSVGLTEAKAKEAGYEVKAGTFPFIGNGKAIALGEAEGFVKTVFDAKTGELLGAHMVGAEVTELIQGYTVGKTAELVETDFINTVYPAPDAERNDARGGALRLMAGSCISKRGQGMRSKLFLAGLRVRLRRLRPSGDTGHRRPLSRRSHGPLRRQSRHPGRR